MVIFHCSVSSPEGMMRISMGNIMGFLNVPFPIHIEHHPETKNHGGCANTENTPCMEYLPTFTQKINPNDPICR